MSFLERIQNEIPISKAMDVSVVSLSETRAELAAPLKPNINHEGTAFGGSVSSLALLASWSLVTTVLDGVEGRFDYVVVQDSSVEFLRPISSDFSAVATFSASVDDFLKTLLKHARARVSVGAEVVCGGVVCARLSARFVAQLAKD